MYICKKCGTQLNDEDAFCWSCGTPVDKNVYQDSAFDPMPNNGMDFAGAGMTAGMNYADNSMKNMNSMGNNSFNNNMNQGMNNSYNNMNQGMNNSYDSMGGMNQNMNNSYNNMKQNMNDSYNNNMNDSYNNNMNQGMNNSYTNNGMSGANQNNQYSYSNQYSDSYNNYDMPQPVRTKDNTNKLLVIGAIVMCAIVIVVGAVIFVLMNKKDKKDNQAQSTVATVEGFGIDLTDGTEENDTEVVENTTEAVTEAQISKEKKMLTFMDLTFYVSKSYDDLVTIDNSSNNGIYYMFFYQKKSQATYGGHLFTIAAYPKNDKGYREIPSYDIIGSNNTYTYIIIYPTDVQFNYEDDEITAEYQALSISNVGQLDATVGSNDSGLVAETTQATTQATTAAPVGNSSEYIFPNSDRSYIQYSDLYNYTRDQVMYARNEIYARHGYIFADDAVYSYFCSKSWYRPSVSKSDFSTSVFNKYENENLKTIVQFEKDMGWR